MLSLNEEKCKLKLLNLFHGCHYKATVSARITIYIIESIKLAKLSKILGIIEHVTR